MGISRMDNAYKQWATENRIRRTGMGIGTVNNEALAELESVARDVKAAMNLRDLAAAPTRGPGRSTKGRARASGPSSSARLGKLCNCVFISTALWRALCEPNDGGLDTSTMGKTWLSGLSRSVCPWVMCGKGWRLPGVWRTP